MDVRYNNDQLALAALGDHPGFTLLLDALKAWEDDAADRMFSATQEGEERLARQDWKGMRSAILAIRSVVESAKQEVSVHNVDPTRYEASSQHYDPADLDNILSSLAGPHTAMYDLLTDQSATLDLGEDNT